MLLVAFFRSCIVCCSFATMFVLVFFFFKQKTAYELRISDWSSDVCSSDLFLGDRLQRREGDRQPGFAAQIAHPLQLVPLALQVARHFEHRSEEHTSELRSLMRISYAVFCLKKKKKINNKH